MTSSQEYFKFFDVDIDTSVSPGGFILGRRGQTAQTLFDKSDSNGNLTPQNAFAAIDLANNFQVQYQTQLSDLEDTNVASAALQLTQESSDFSAAMSAESRVPTTTLFDYLPLTSG